MPLLFARIHALSKSGLNRVHQFRGDRECRELPASPDGITTRPGLGNAWPPKRSVVNVDNGFGAACIASLINRL